MRTTYLFLFTVLIIKSVIAQAPSTNALPEQLARMSAREWHLAEPLSFPFQPIRATSVFSNNLIVVSHSNFIGCIGIDSGSFKWKTSISGKYLHLPFAGDHIALIQSMDLQKEHIVEIKALDIKNGNELWRESITNEISSPIFLNGRMYVGMQGDRLLCIDQKSRDKKWEKEIPGLLLSQDSLLGNDLVVGLGSNSLARINTSTGELVWKSEFKYKPMRIWAQGDRIFMHINYDTKMYCVSGQDGSLLWKTESPLVTVPPRVSGNMAVLLGQSSYLSHFYGLIIVNLQTGEPIWHDGGDGSVGSSALARDILYYRRGGALSAFDLQRGIKVGFWIIDDTFDLFQGSHNSVLWVSQKYGVLTFRPNLYEIRAYRDNDLLKLSRSSLGGLVKLLIFIGSFIVITIIGSGGKRTIPGTPDTAGMLAALWVVLAGFVLVQLYAVWLIWSLGEKQGFTAALAMGLISLVFSLLLFLLGYVLHNRLYAHILFKTRAHSVPEAVNYLLAGLVNEMGINKPVTVICGSKHESPAVVSDQKRHYVIIPLDFEKTAAIAAHENTELAQGLERFVLAHELAHVKAGDFKVLPLLWMGRWLWVVSVLGILSWIWANISGNKDLAFVERPVVMIGIVVSGVCWLISCLVSRAKEKYADGVAAMSIAPEILQNVMRAEDETSRGSILHNYLFLLRMGGRYSWRFSGFAQTMKGFASETSARGKEIIGKTAVLKAGSVVSPILAVVAGLSGAIILGLADVQKILMFCHLLVGQYGGIADYWLKGAPFWNESQGLSVNYAALALTGIISASVLLAPLRDSHRESDLLNLVFIGWVTVLILGSLIIMSIADGMISSLILHGILKFKVFGLHDGVPIMIILGVCAGLWAVMLGRWVIDVQDVLFSFVNIFNGLILAFLPWVIIIKYFDGLPITSRILLCVAASITSGILVNLGLGTVTDREKIYSNEGMAYCRFLSIRFIRIRLNDGYSKLLSITCSLLGFVFQFTLPTLLIALLAYPHLMRLDQWYMNSSGLEMESLHQTMELPIEDIKQKGMGLWYNEGFAYAMSMFGGPDKLNASGVALLLSVMALLLLGMVAVIGRSFRLNDSKRINIITQGPILAYLSTELGCQLFSTAHKQAYANNIQKGFRKRSAFVKGIERISLMAATCDAVAVGGVLSAEYYVAGLEWIRKCSNKNGGFGYAPGKTPDLLHTLSGITALQKTGMLAGEDGIKHLAWLRRELRNTIKQGTAQYPTEGLARLYYAAKAISAIGAAFQDQRDKHEILAISVSLWENTLKTEENTFHVAEILHEIGIKGDILPDEIKKRINGYEVRLNQMDPKHDLENIFRMIRMVRAAHPQNYQDRSSIMTTRDNLAKIYGTSKPRSLTEIVEYYLRKIQANVNGD